MKKRILAALMAVMMIVSACGAKPEATDAPAEQPAATEAAAEDEVVTITYWGWDSNYYQPMFEAYEAINKNVKFEATATEWGDMLTKAQQALASGSELPTIIPMDITLIGNWKNMGIMEDLTTYGLDTSIYNQALIEAATDADGKVIGLFENICPSGIAYKRDLALEYFGTDDPDELSKIFSSYDAYVEKGKEVAEKSNGEVFLFHSGQAVAEWLYFASDVANVTGDTINMTEKMTDVLGKLVALRDAGAVDSYSNGTPEANATYTGKNHIFYPCPDWALTYYIEVNDPDGFGNWGLIKAPSGYSHGGTAMGITSAASDAQKQAAYEFMMWAISSEEGATAAKDKAGYITPDTTIATPDFYTRADEDFFGGQEISKLYYGEIASGISIASPSAFDNDIVSVRNDVAQQIMDETDMTLEEAVTASVEILGQLVTDDSVTIK